IRFIFPTGHSTSEKSTWRKKGGNRLDTVLFLHTEASWSQIVCGPVPRLPVSCGDGLSGRFFADHLRRFHRVGCILTGCGTFGTRENRPRSGLFLLLFLAGTLPQSFFTAGAYGAAAACVFRGKSTIGSFFSEGFRNLWKMFGQQVLLVLFLMVALLLVIFPFGLLVRTEEPPHILIFLFLLILAGYLWVSLHAPLFLVVERTGVWNSILLSFRLIMKKPGQTLLSGLFALAILLGILLLAASILIVLPLLFMNLMEENGAVAALVILGILCFLPVIPYAFAAALLAVVHRYSTRLRHGLFPESHQDGEAAGAAPVPDQ